MSWASLNRKSHALIGIISVFTLGVIALSCFPIAHKGFGAAGNFLVDVHKGKFLPDNLRWIWIDSQGLFLLWLVVSGYVLHRKVKKRRAQQIEDSDGRVLVLFGTQTGNSEAVANRLARKLTAAGVPSRVANFSEYGFLDLSRETRLAAVTSTYGEGEMPDDAAEFWKSLCSPKARQLDALHFTVLGLGDSSYEKFCQAAKDLDRRLEELGARRIHPCVCCDVDFAEPSSAWIDAVVGYWKPEIGAVAANPKTVAISAEAGLSEAPTACAPAAPFSRKNPFPSRLLENRRLSASHSQKETRHFRLDLAESGVDYEPGDVLAVRPSNCHTLVQHVLDAGGYRGNESVPTADGAGETSLREALVSHYEITRIPAPLAKLVNGGPDDPSLAGCDVLDLMVRYRDRLPGAEAFVECLQPLQPRLYSISSSHKANPGEVHLTVSTVRYTAGGRERKGVCSTFLADRVADPARIPIFFQKADHFRLPADPATPIIMVGPGTGIAPFRAFLQERREVGASGRAWLFFGEQRSETDFLYREELETFARDGYLTRLSTAFSRDQKTKIYVQHRMEEEARELWAWLQDGAHFYVCGDASRMAKDVHQALLAVARQQGGMDDAEAAQFVAQLADSGRYQRDVY
jgi:sulfite reductase (NADPH) flavoprotein alpha-component